MLFDKLLAIVDGDQKKANAIVAMLNDSDTITELHLAIEDKLIDYRDSSLFDPLHANGFIVRNYDGTENTIMRFGTRAGIEFAMQAFKKEN